MFSEEIEFRLRKGLITFSCLPNDSYYARFIYDSQFVDLLALNNRRPFYCTEFSVIRGAPIAAAAAVTFQINS